MRHLRTLLVLAALASLVAIAGCSTPSATPSAPSGGSGPAASVVSVTLQNFAFNPADITVAVGGTVTFKNNDSVAHNIAGDGWSTGSLAPGATSSHTFATAGTFPIHCLIHPSMTANVTVK
jgi:plastocyanin